MPFINIKTNRPVSSEKEIAIKSALGQAITAIPGKSESWLMAGIEPEYILYFGQANPSAFNSLTEKLCTVLNEQLDIDPSRIYVKYTATTDWGWNGSNF